MNFMKTEMYEAVIGIIPGYEPGKRVDKNINLDDVSEICQKIFSSSDVKVISGVIEECKAVYPVDWGAPIGGEYCFKVTFTRNPEFDKDKDEFKKAVLDNVKRLKEHFQQETVTVTVNDWGRVSMKRFVKPEDFDEEE